MGTRTSSTLWGPLPPGPPSDKDPRLSVVFLADGRLLVRMPRNEERIRRMAQRMWERGWRLSEAEPEDANYSVMWFVRRPVSG